MVGRTGDLSAATVTDGMKARDPGLPLIPGTHAESGHPRAPASETR
jgi:hypothetical protein